MNALIFFIFEIIFIGFSVLLLHRLRKVFGIGLLFVYIGTVQFFQTLLASNVYNEIFEGIIVSPGSAILFTSTFFCILLILHTEGINRAQTAIFGTILSNVLLSILSILTLDQIKLDDNSANVDFLKEILNIDVTMFLIGTILLLIDLVLIAIFYQFINLNYPKTKLFLKIYLPLMIVCLLDSILFYYVNFFPIETEISLLYSNIVGKQISILIFSLLLYSYLKFFKLETPKEVAEKIEDILSITVFKKLHHK